MQVVNKVREDIKIYIATHSDFVAKVPAIYEPLLVGSDFNVAEHVSCKDNVGDNISRKNRSYCELTALYWMWKNSNSDVLGLVHYRRFFPGLVGNHDLFGILGAGEVRHYLSTHDILLIKEYQLHKESVYDQYKACHNEADMVAVREIIAKKCPDYNQAFQDVMLGSKLVRYNMFVANKTLVDEYCQWLFPLLFELEEVVSVSDYDGYQKRVYGFLAERLFTVWLAKRKPRIKYFALRNIERQKRRQVIRIWLRAFTRRWLK